MRHLKGILDCYRQEDPATTPKLAVPVKITEAILDQHNALSRSGRHSIKRQATADLINVAFYYLLRVSEYTSARAGKRTKPFTVACITFRDAAGNWIPANSPLSALLKATEATMRIPNQKSGIKGQCIHNECTGTNHSPVKSLARRVHHILTNGGTGATPIFSFKEPTSRLWRHITATDVSTTLKDAAESIGLCTLGYTRDDISTHSLRAGGAMAMHLNGIDTKTIQKMGRWRSETFLMYIHEQISAFAAGVSVKMSHHIPFRHIAGPTLQRQAAAA